MHQNNLRRWLSLFLFLTCHFSLWAQYTTPSHSYGTCKTTHSGYPEAKAAIRSILITNQYNNVVYQKIFDGKGHCTRNNYTYIDCKDRLFLGDQQTYTLLINPINPDGSESLVSCGAWIDYDQDSSFDDPGEMITTESWVTSTRYDNKIRFSPKKVGKTGVRRLRIRTEYGRNDLGKNSHSDTLQYGETLDIDFKLFTNDSFEANFWMPDTAYVYSEVDMINPYPNDTIEHTWSTNGPGKHGNYGSGNADFSYVFYKTGTFKVKLVSTLKSGASDSIEKRITIIQPKEPVVPDLFVDSSYIELYQSFDIVNTSRNFSNYYRISMSHGKDTMTSKFFHIDSGRSDHLTVFTASGIPGFPDKGTWDVCLEAGHLGMPYSGAAKVCKTNAITVGTDDAPPYIVLNGPDTIFVNLDSGYHSPGAMAFDNLDGHISDSIRSWNNIDTSKTGTYKSWYLAKDASNNWSDTVVRIVKVVDHIAPAITLNGKNPVCVDLYSHFTDAGATALDNADGDISHRIIVKGTINTFVLGTYVLTYIVTDNGGNSDTVTRVVVVGDCTAPVITLNGADTIYVDVDSLWNDPGAQAFDKVDGGLTDSIHSWNNVNTSILGTYYVWYVVTDSYGNISDTVVRVVVVIDRVAPVITLLGRDTVYVKVNTTYKDSGATAQDNYDGDVTDSIKVANDVDVSTVGTYSVRYVVFDSSGNSDTVYRIVVVDDRNSVVFNELSQFRIFPNPASSILHIETTLIDKLEEIRVINTLGQAFSVSHSNSGQQTHLDIRHLTPGLYLIIATDGHTQWVETFLKE